MILLLSPYETAPECARLIERETNNTVKLVNTTKLALAALRARSFDMVVADENLLESAPESSDSLLQRMESATPFFIDMAVMRPQKVARLVALTSKRRELEFEMARERALVELRGELKSDLTGLLICSELALDAAGVTMPVAEKLNAVLEIARRMQSRLDAKEGNRD
jgi:hypothetical protein